MNPEMRGTEFPISKYRQALRGSMGFGSILLADSSAMPFGVSDIFHSYDGYPSEDILRDLIKRTKLVLNNAPIFQN